MAFAILRIDKKKDMAQIRRMADHHLRTKPVSNADPERSIEVLAGADKAADVVAIIDGATKPLIQRKDNVRCFDVLMTASPEFFREGGSVAEFKERAMTWATDTFGVDNVVSAVMHLDETTPHIQLLVTPIRDGKLNAKSWTGKPALLREMQDSFAKAMEPLGLERGVKYSKAEHTDIAHWYGELEPKLAKAEQVIEKADELLELRKHLELAQTSIATEKYTLDRKAWEMRAQQKQFEHQVKNVNDQIAKVRTALIEDRKSLDAEKQTVAEMKKFFATELENVRQFAQTLITWTHDALISVGVSPKSRDLPKMPNYAPLTPNPTKADMALLRPKPEPDPAASKPDLPKPT